MPYGGEYFSKGLTSAVIGTTDWKSVEIPFVLQKDERPDLFKLGMEIEPNATRERVELPETVWIKDIELWEAPLPAELRRPSRVGPAPGFKPGTVKSFSHRDMPAPADRVKEAGTGWVTGADPVLGEAKATLFDVTDFHDDACLVTYRAMMGSDLMGKAYLEMECDFGGERAYSKGLAMPVSGRSEWASYETSFRLEKGQRPDRIRLNVVIEGKGPIWIKDVELLRGPLPK
jgi:hypothetical protein